MSIILHFRFERKAAAEQKHIYYEGEYCEAEELPNGFTKIRKEPLAACWVLLMQTVKKSDRFPQFESICRGPVQQQHNWCLMSLRTGVDYET